MRLQFDEVVLDDGGVSLVQSFEGRLVDSAWERTSDGTSKSHGFFGRRKPIHTRGIPGAEECAAPTKRQMPEVSVLGDRRKPNQFTQPPNWSKFEAEDSGALLKSSIFLDLGFPFSMNMQSARA